VTNTTIDVLRWTCVVTENKCPRIGICIKPGTPRLLRIRSF